MSATAPSAAPAAAYHDASTAWKEIVRKYQQPSVRKSVWQMVNTLVPYLLIWVAMYFVAPLSLWALVPLSVLLAAFFVRTFIIFHDCTHGSFFESKRANEIVGFFTGIITLTPFHHWRWEHSVHHAHTGNLDRRGIGDVWTLTVQEYIESPWWRRVGYRIIRNPVVLFIIAPIILFVIIHRLPVKGAGARERFWLHFTNLGILLQAAATVYLFGWAAYLVITFTSLLVATATGVWLFYVQHQFEDVYWERRHEWDFLSAAMEGSSFYKLPRILQWFTGNIGFHHIHHLSPRIPNYELERAHESEPFFQQVQPLTIRTSLKSLTFRLVDEENKRLTDYRAVRARREELARAAAATAVAAPTSPAEQDEGPSCLPLPKLALSE